MDVFPDLFVRVQDWYAAFNAGDADPLRGHTTPAARDAVSRLWATQQRELHPTDLHVAAGGLVVVDVHQVVRDAAGRIVAEGDVRHLYRFDGDSVQEMTVSPRGTPSAP